MVLYCSYYWTSIKSVNWTAILAATQSNQSTGQPSWLSLNQTSKLDSHPSCHSIKPVSESWRPIGRLKGRVWGGGSPPRKDQMTPTTTRRQVFYLARPLAHSVQGRNIPFGESLTSTWTLPQKMSSVWSMRGLCRGKHRR